MTEGKPLSEKPLGYLLSVAGGLLGGPIGLIASPLVLFGLNKALTPSEGKAPNRFRAWALTGIVGAPICLALTAAIAPSSQIPSSATAPQAVDAPAAPRPQTGVTMANFSRLQSGMSYPEAVSILGAEGTVMSSSDIAGYSTVMYQWDGEGGFGANMNATFQNGKLVSKAQFGLK